MAGSIFLLFNTAISTVSSWFVSLMSKSGLTSVFLAGFFLSLLLRYFVAPLVGSSDSVKRRSKDE